MNTNALSLITTSTLLALAKGGEGAELAREAIKEAPETALTVIAQGGFTALTAVNRRIAAVATDEVIGAIGDDERSIALINDHFTKTQQIEMLNWWGDRFSGLVELVAPETLVEALAAEIASEGLAAAAVVIRAWANKLKDRPDWDQILSIVTIDDVTVRQILVAAMLADGDDAWSAVGLDDEDVGELIEELPDGLLELTIGDLRAAREGFRVRREQEQTEDDQPTPEVEDGLFIIKGDSADV